MPDSRLRITLIDTSPRGLRGSMGEYAGLVQRALESSDESGLEVDRVRLALPYAILSRLRPPMRNWLHHGWILAFARHRLRRIASDLLHVLDGSHAYIVRHLPPSASVVTVHDVIPALQLAGTLGTQKPGKRARWLVEKALSGYSNADVLISVSSRTSSDLLKVCQIDRARVHVVGLAAPEVSENPLSPQRISERLGRSTNGERYLLHVGHDAFYKNRPGVLRIYALVREACNVRLKLVGPAPAPDLRELIGALDVSRSVDFIVNPERDALFDLYRNASLLLFPSLYEGFGWPPLEAMALGCPVVCSDAGSLPEVVGDAALTAAPQDLRQLADLCLSVLQPGSLAHSLVERGFLRAREFSAQKIAAGLMAAYEHALDSRRLTT